MKNLRTIFLLLAFFYLVSCDKTTNDPIVSKQLTPNQPAKSLFVSDGVLGYQGGSKSSSNLEMMSCTSLPIGSLAITSFYATTPSGYCTDPVTHEPYPNFYMITNGSNLVYGYYITITSGGVLTAFLGSGTSAYYNYTSGPECIAAPILPTGSTVTGSITPLDDCYDLVPSGTVNFSFNVPSPSPVRFVNNGVGKLSWIAVSGAGAYLITDNAGGSYSTTATSLNNYFLFMGPNYSVGQSVTATVTPLYPCGNGQSSSTTFTITSISNGGGGGL